MKTYGDIKANEDNGTLNVYIDESHSLMPQLREIGGRYNQKKNAFVIGSTYPARVNKAIEALDAYNEACLSNTSEIETGQYGPVYIYQPFPDSGYILVFLEFNPELKDRMKRTLVGASYVGFTRSWHIPFEQKKELRNFLSSLTEK